ncbi:MAG TPA: hypothetical protein VM324_00135 [Egibacteraceae bacterium]|jgi:erythritol/L-threitol dehydrogenase|nr:hypothetical protein [Egibacteraceae bacterium]
MMASGALPVERIVTHRLPLADFAQGLALVADATESIKVILQP